MKDTIFIVDDKEKYKNDIKLFLTKGVKIVSSKDKIDNNTKNIICATTLSGVAQLIYNGNTLDNLIIQDGFIGENILTEKGLAEHLKGKEYFQGDAISKDIEATEQIMKTKEDIIGNIYMLGLNVEEYLGNGNFAKESINILNKQIEIFKYFRVYIEHSDGGWISKLNLMNQAKSRNVNVAISCKGE